MKPNQKRKLYRQGDVLIEEIGRVPSRSEKQKPSRNIILARGEATGHHHLLELDDPADWWKNGDEIFVSLTTSPRVSHQEHATIELPEKRIVRVRRQREYSPAEIRRVAD